jgi:hypothetical protein
MSNYERSMQQGSPNYLRINGTINIMNYRNYDYTNYWGRERMRKEEEEEHEGGGGRRRRRNTREEEEEQEGGGGGGGG